MTRKEKDLNQNMVVKLETDLQLFQSSYVELSRQLETCQANKEKLKEREAEVSSLCNCLLVKEQEAEGCVLSTMQMEALFEKAQKGNSLSKFGEWDEKYPAPAEGIRVIFNRARVNSKKEGGTPTDTC
ncbi:uncharacterized protein LOC111493198 isoform X2 [Cucurbita maxima]|uniref:Uncharacterized protein LOC111493198 isoform X2 n=1 Tax=Cucurbita maxima TaxID=3661 RepID=A0A6J1KAM8_CUCMA|nr:uncharacterized protein LOC111493198 isoform X2 [Cucurbita maxima]